MTVAPSGLLHADVNRFLKQKKDVSQPDVSPMRAFEEHEHSDTDSLEVSIEFIENAENQSQGNTKSYNNYYFKYENLYIKPLQYWYLRRI